MNIVRGLVLVKKRKQPRLRETYAGTEAREQSVEFLIAEQGEIEGQRVLVEGEPSDQGGGIVAEKLFSRKAARVREDAR